MGVAIWKEKYEKARDRKVGNVRKKRKYKKNMVSTGYR
jgi:hypothetical protein